MRGLPQFRTPLGRHLARLPLTPDNLRTESDRCRSERLLHFRQLAEDPAAYQRFLNRSLPVESQ
jgi:hypothetical protein